MHRLCRSVDFLRWFTLTLLIIWPGLAYPTTIDPFTWEQLVLDADFVGIVECEVAGGVAAKYKVIESWKGPAAGTKLTIGIAVNYWEPQFPIALCGQRCLVTAFKSPWSNIMSFSSGGMVPLWWRNIPTDYGLPLFQGLAIISGERDGEAYLQGVGSDHSDIESFKKAVEELLRASPAEQEEQLLKALSKKYLLRCFSIHSLMQEKSEKMIEDANVEQIYEELEKAKEQMQKDIEKAKSPEELIDLALTTAMSNPERFKNEVERVFSQGCGSASLTYLQKRGVANTPWNEEEFKYLLRSIQYRITPNEQPSKIGYEDYLKSIENNRPSEEQLNQMRETLASVSETMSTDQFYEVLEPLTIFDPGSVADYLCKWVNPEKDWRDKDMGYQLGSYFGWRCGKDREKNLRKLLEAKDPYIRVAGAVYLCFENKKLGVSQLKKMTKLEGDPGVWAAINLARRGYKPAMGRALEVFATAGESNMAGVSHRNLQKRIIVLLSNSAQKSNITQPFPPPKLSEYYYKMSDGKKQQDYIRQYLVDWWKDHKDKLVLHDPWLATLEKQKID